MYNDDKESLEVKDDKCSVLVGIVGMPGDTEY